MYETHIVENDELRRPSTIIIANRKEQTILGDGRDQLLQEQGQQNTADGSQIEVMNLEQAVEFERLSVPHEFASTEDDDIIRDQTDGRFRHGAHRGLARDEVEVLGRIAAHALERLGKDGPQGDAEWSFQGRRTVLKPIWLAHGEWFYYLFWFKRFR